MKANFNELKVVVIKDLTVVCYLLLKHTKLFIHP